MIILSFHKSPREETLCVLKEGSIPISAGSKNLQGLNKSDIVGGRTIGILS